MCKSLLLAVLTSFNLLAQTSDLSEQQTAALVRMSADLSPQLESLSEARAGYS